MKYRLRKPFFDYPVGYVAPVVGENIAIGVDEYTIPLFIVDRNPDWFESVPDVIQQTLL